MNNISILLENENFFTIFLTISIIAIILSFINIIYFIYLNKKYIKFMNKLGNGNNLDEMLRKYLEDVNEIKKDNSEIKAYYTQLDNNIDSCIQKIGLVRYNAFKDVGSDLSFAIALLDRNDNGIVFNGLYGAESSNIFAKPIKDGTSKYQLSEEEKQALEIAAQNKNFITKQRNM